MSASEQQQPAPADDHVSVWKRRARVRKKLTIVLAVLTVVLLILTIRLVPILLPRSGASNGGVVSSQPSQIWVIVPALGTLATGLGTLVSGIAAILALRAAGAARDTAAMVRKPNMTKTPANRPAVKRKPKR